MNFTNKSIHNPNETFNFCSQENNITIHSYSSQHSQCLAENVLISEQKKIWLSENGLPQYIIFNFSKCSSKPDFYNAFGFECWHDYPTNPSAIELSISKNEEDFITWSIIHAKLVSGKQYFHIDPLESSFKLLKIAIKETFGEAKTYINQIFLLAEFPKEIFLNDTENNQILQEEENEKNALKIEKDDENILLNYIEKSNNNNENNNTNFNNLSQSNQKNNTQSSKNTTTKFFYSHGKEKEQQHEETNLKANNILKYYDKYLNFKAENHKKQNESEISSAEKLFFLRNKTNLQQNLDSDKKNSKDSQTYQEKEMNVIKEEIAKFNEKFSKIQQTMEILMEKQLEIQKSIVLIQDESKIHPHLSDLFEKKMEVAENFEDQFANSKLYIQLEEFLSRMNEQNEKIIEENNNLKEILEMKINNLEEKIENLSSKDESKDDLEKRIEGIISKNIGNLTRTLNESMEKYNQKFEKNIIEKNMRNFVHEENTFNNQSHEKSIKKKYEYLKQKKESQKKSDELFHKLEFRLSQREKEIEEIDKELLESKSLIKNKNFGMNPKYNTWNKK